MRSAAAGVRDKMTWWEATTTAAPAATQPGNTPLLAWRGNRNSRNITLANVIGPPRQFAGSTLEKTILADASDYAPSFLPGVTSAYDARLAWTGIDYGRAVKVADFALTSGDWKLTGGMTQHGLVGYGQIGGTSGPDMSVLQRYRVNVVDQYGRVVLAQANGISFGETIPLPFFGTPRGPVRNIGLGWEGTVWMWTASDGALSFAFTDSAVPATDTPVVVRSAQWAICEPAAFTPFRDSVYIAWTGTDGAGHLNVAPVDLAAVKAGTDPIGAVYTLPETSIAAPALVPQMDWDHGNHRLAVFWTGTDGSGALNACEVVLP
ncbi:hypothetical protein [Streptomyces sp. TLI_146]|uniref:hypothetical protein n=1 Tax=Streptomyces sp. TLI_146 TaxID=1938858 RepID=UPI000C70C384|nr:hypothetical protein [Streptomyces sp. TLI_146]